MLQLKKPELQPEASDRQVRASVEAMLTDIMSDPKSLEKALQLPSESAKARMAKDIARELAIFSSVKAEQQ